MPSTATKARKTTSKESERVDIDQVVTDRIIEALEAGVVPWRCPWARDASVMPSNATTLTPYRGINVLMLWLGSMMGGYSSPYWLTFNQARNSGGAPRKGERGTPCVRWVEWDRVLTDGEAREAQAAGKPVRRDEKGRHVLRSVGARGFTVFNVEQCGSGLTVELPAPSQWQPSQWDRIASAEAVLFGMTDGPTIREEGDRACYQPSADVVVLPERERFPEAQAFYATGFHELTHATGHETRLNRRDLADAMQRNHAAYAREELTAEVGAAMLCARAGLEIPAEESAGYIADWLGHLRNDRRLVITAAQHAQKAVDLIVGAQR